jgi:hypothetical protein
LLHQAHAASAYASSRPGEDALARCRRRHRCRSVPTCAIPLSRKARSAATFASGRRLLAGWRRPAEPAQPIALEEGRPRWYRMIGWRQCFLVARMLGPAGLKEPCRSASTTVTFSSTPSGERCPLALYRGHPSRGGNGAEARCVAVVLDSANAPGPCPCCERWRLPWVWRATGFARRAGRSLSEGRPHLGNRALADKRTANPALPITLQEALAQSVTAANASGAPAGS